MLRTLVITVHSLGKFLGFFSIFFFNECQTKNENLLNFQSPIQERERYFLHNLVGLNNEEMTEHSIYHPFWHHSFPNSNISGGRTKDILTIEFMFLCKADLDSNPLLLHSTPPLSYLFFINHIFISVYLIQRRTLI